MRMNKCAYLFAAALVASTVGMTSCSNEDVAGIENIQGQQTKVSMALSVAPSTRSTADQVNLGDNKLAIANVAVVPMVDKVSQKPVRWTSVTSTGESDPQTVQLLSSVNGFKVYGNLTETQYAATENAFSLTDEMFKLQQSKANSAYKAPHSQLYYYSDVKANGFQTTSTGDSWENASGWAPAATIGTAKFVKISDIDYAVGILAAAVINGDTKQCFEKDGSPCDASTAGVTVTGVIVNNQRDFKTDFTLGDTPYEVYETAAKANFSDAGIGTANAKNGNIYMIAAPTQEADEVNVNIEFLLPAGVSLTKTDGNKITGAEGTGTKIYLGLKLKGQGQANSQKVNTVFAADYVTYLNATVKNWGIASETPVEVTDAEIGVEFNVDWQEGNIYNLDI